MSNTAFFLTDYKLETNVFGESVDEDDEKQGSSWLGLLYVFMNERNKWYETLKR